MLALASAVLLLHLSACQRNPSDALAATKARMAKNEDAAAEIELKNYLQRNPQSGEARYLLGLQAQKRGDGAAALIEFQRAIDLKHPDTIVVPAIAKSLLAQGKFKQIIDEFGSTQLSEPLATAELQGLVAQALHFDGDLQAASALINRAAAAAPASESVQLAKASFEAQANRPDQAVAVLDGLLALKPDSHLAWTMKGNVLGVLPGRRDAAIAAFRKALGLKKDDVAARTGVIALSLQAGDTATADQELALLRKQAPKHPNTQYYQANLAFANGKYSEAQSLYQAVLRMLPLHPAVLLSAADNELKLNAPVQAETLAAKVLSQSPDNLRARHLLAQVYLRMGQPSKALASLSSQIDSPQASPETLALAAQAQLMNGNVAAADQLYTRMATLQPSDPALRTLLATASLGKVGDEQVYDTLQTISASDKGSTADLALISAQLRGRQFDAALKSVENLIRKQPDQAGSYQLKAQVLSRQNDMAGARQALDQALAKDPTYLPAVLGLAAIDMRSQKPDQARQRVEDLSKKQPANAQALVALAEISAEAGQPAKTVLGYIERAVKVNPGDPDIWAALIDQHLSYGDVRASLAAAQSAVAANPKSIQLLDRLGRAEVRTGQSDQALSTFGKITSLHPRSLIGLLGQAEVHIAAGRPAEADRLIAKVLERDPRNLLAQSLAFGSALQQKQYKAAAEMARSVKQQRPADASGTLMEAEIEAQQGHGAAAIALWRQALALNGPGQAPAKLHAALAGAGKAADADAMATAWLKDHPGDLAFQIHLATLARQQGRLDLSEQRLRQVLKQQPNQVSTLNDLAMLLALQGKAESVPLAEQALKHAPDNPAVLDTLARAQVSQNDLSKAIETQKRAVLLAPNEPSLRLALAHWEFKAGNKAAAKRNLDGVQGQADKLGAEDRAILADLTKALKPG